MRSHASTPPTPCNWLLLLPLLLSSAAAIAPSEGCYERIAIGRRIKATDVIATLPTSSLSRCREECDKRPNNQCNSFGFGIGRKLNGTCELSSATIPTDPIPPFIRIESTSTLKLHSSKPGSPPSLNNETSKESSSVAPSVTPTVSSTENSTTSDRPSTNGNVTDSARDSNGAPSEADNETAPPLETVSDVDFDVYAKRPSSLCQRSPGAIDPWILRPLPSTPASPPSPPPSTPSSPPPSPDSRPPSPSPSHPHNHHHNNHHDNHHQHHLHGPGPQGPTDFRRPIPSNRLQPPPLFQTPAMQMPPYPFRPQPSPPSSNFMPPYNDGSFGPSPSQGGFHPSPPHPDHQHHHFPGPPVHNGSPQGGPNNGGFSHNGIPLGGSQPNVGPNGGPPSGGLPNGGSPYGGAPTTGHHDGGVPLSPPHGGGPNGGAPHNGAPFGGPPHGGPPHGGPSNNGGAPFGGPPFAGPPNGGGPHGAAPPGGSPNQPPQPNGGGPQQPGSQHANGGAPNFGDGANMIPEVPCFHRVTTGRLLAESLSHRTMQAPNLDDCRRLCSTEHQFRCEGFLYRWDTRLCALTAAPLSEIRFQEHAHAPSAEYFARTAIGHGICPPRDGSGGSHGNRGPQGPAAWPSRGFGDGGSSAGRPFGGQSGGGGASWSSSGGGSRAPQRGGSNGQQLPGFYGAPSADGGGGGGWAQQPERTGPSDHRFDVRGGGGGGGGGWGNRWRGGGGGVGDGSGGLSGGGGGWSSGDGGRVRGGHPPAGPPPASSSYRPVDRPPSGPSGPWSSSGGGTGGWTKGQGEEEDECFVLVKRGFRLTPDGRPHPPPSDHEDAHASDLVFMSVRVRSRDPEDCAKECYRSAMFHCDAYSYRFNGDPRTQGLSNCDLSGQPLKKLDPYKDLVQDRDYDVYGRTSGRACGDGAIMIGSQRNGGHLKRPPPPRRGGNDAHRPPPPPPARPTERPTKPAPPSYLDNSIGTGSGWSDSDNQNGGHKGQQDVTVGGRPCAHGSTCTRHPDGGFWGCPVSSFGQEKEMVSGSGRDWDYCCRPGHQCGYSEGYHLPWCYVGSADRDQWRPCSQEHYPPPSSTSSVASSSHINNSTIGNGHQHHHHDNHHNSINQVAYLHSDKQKESDNHTKTHHEHSDPHGVTSLVSMPHSDLNKQQHSSDEEDATIQKILDLLVSNGKGQDRLPVNEDNKLQTSIKSEEEENRHESRSGRGNRAYSRRTEEVRHFYPKYSHSRSKPRVHEIRDDYDEESEETRIIQSNFTVVEDTDE